MCETIYRWDVASPVGRLYLESCGETLVALSFDPLVGEALRDPGPFEPVVSELEAYFAGVLRSFSVSLETRGTPFQQRVWQELCQIPYGQTWSYAHLAESIGQPRAVRAVGLANGRNPIAIIVPCHRVIGKNGSLTGYGGGLERKRLLLQLEQGIQELQLSFSPNE